MVFVVCLRVGENQSKCSRECMWVYVCVIVLMCVGKKQHKRLSIAKLAYLLVVENWVGSLFPFIVFPLPSLLRVLCLFFFVLFCFFLFACFSSRKSPRWGVFAQCHPKNAPRLARLTVVELLCISSVLLVVYCMLYRLCHANGVGVLFILLTCL